LNYLQEHWIHSKKLNRGDFLIFREAREQYLYFVESGTFRIWFPADQEEATVGFGYPGTLLTSFPSFVKGLPSDYFIQSLSKCSVTAISRTHFYDGLHQFHELELVWREWVEGALLGRIEREIDLLTANPAIRLERLITRSPHLFQWIPLKYIASYLRMTPETLSRLRNS
jgi:CRP-like cAMP-binding protein